ncbi:hypothetical protein H9P43_003795 [Blastocladiella emersonii ATCC 22665]|nr:hypothetical protein H9P43_003795 [Blastocladiella emersonii ATCC 22665]
MSSTGLVRGVLPFPIPATYRIKGDEATAAERQVTFHTDGSYTVVPADPAAGDHGKWTYNAPDYAVTFTHEVSPTEQVTQTWKFGGMTRDMFASRIAGSTLVATEGDDKLAKAVPIPADAGAYWARDRDFDEKYMQQQ